MSVTCDACGQEIRTAPGCVPSPGVYLFGDEPIERDEPLDDDERCRDCACLVGHAHHLFCCVAICRACSDEEGEPTQRLFCPHFAEQAEALGIEPPDL